MTTKKDKTIYCVSGDPAGGTSLLMKVLISGGIDGVYTKRDVPKNRFVTNNPDGVFEGGWIETENGTQVVIPEKIIGKAVKTLGISWRLIPDDYHIKMIRIKRDKEDVADSRLRRRERKRELGATIPDKTKEQLIKGIENSRKRFADEFKKRKNIECLEIEFNDMFLDTENQCKRIAEFIKPREFDWKKATTAIDRTLDHGEKTQLLNK